MNWADLWTDYTVRNVALGCAILGAVSGALGCLSVLRRQALVGDALSHAALPGVCLAFMLSQGNKAPLLLMVGAAVACTVAMAWIQLMLTKTKTDSSTALSVASSVFFGFGILLLTIIQKSGDSNKAGLDKFLFGQAAALVQESVITMAVLGGFALLGLLVLFKEIRMLVFDPLACEIQGWPVGKLNLVTQGLLVTAIVIGLNTVGVILMSAMLVAPAAAARQWTQSLSTMMLVAASSGAICGVLAALISTRQSSAPTGPILVLLLMAWVCLSFVFGSHRGLLWRSRLRNRYAENLT